MKSSLRLWNLNLRSALGQRPVPETLNNRANQKYNFSYLANTKGVTKIILLTLKEAEEVTTASLMVRRGGTGIYTVLIS